MDREARLAAILKAVKENQELSEQAQYGIQLALVTKEWQHLKRCVEKIIAIELVNEDLSIEAKSLQEDIEASKLEVLT